METIVVPRHLTRRMQEALDASGETNFRTLLVAKLRASADRANPYIAVGEEMGVTPTTVYRWCQLFGIHLVFTSYAGSVTG